MPSPPHKKVVKITTQPMKITHQKMNCGKMAKPKTACGFVGCVDASKGIIEEFNTEHDQSLADHKQISMPHGETQRDDGRIGSWRCGHYWKWY